MRATKTIHEMKSALLSGTQLTQHGLPPKQSGTPESAGGAEGEEEYGGAGGCGEGGRGGVSGK